MWQPDSQYLIVWQPDLIVKSDQMLTIHDSCQKNPETAVFEAKKLRQKMSISRHLLLPDDSS